MGLGQRLLGFVVARRHVRATYADLGIDIAGSWHIVASRRGPFAGRRRRPAAAGQVPKDGFEPALTFQVGTGWHAAQDAAGFFDVEQQPGSLDVIAVQFGRPAGASTAREAVQQLRQQRGIVVRGVTDQRVAGLAATRVLIDNADPDLQAQRFADVLRLEAGELSIGSGRRLQVDLVDTPDGLLAILVGGSVRHWAATLQLAGPVVASVRLLGG